MDYKALVDLIGKYLPHPQAIELNKWVDSLRRENEELRTQVSALKKTIEEQSAPPARINRPTCPNCSTVSRPYYMSSIPVEFVPLEGNTHECKKCGFKDNFPTADSVKPSEGCC